MEASVMVSGCSGLTAALEMICQALAQSEHDNNERNGQQGPDCQSEDIEPISAHAEKCVRPNFVSASMRR